MDTNSNYLRWMTPTIGDTFPDLQGETQDINDFSLYEYLGDQSWGLVFMHPGDFTPVCTTELGAAQSLKAEFYARNTKICGFSCDDAASHRAWIADIQAATGQRLEFPVFCDSDRQHAIELGVFDPQLKNSAGLPQTVRSVFILKPDKTIALTMTYPSSVGRNFDEILRVLDALQRSEDYSVNTPANWQPGDRTVVPYSLSDKQANEKFGKDGYVVADLPSERGRSIKKHYLRYTDDPLLTDTQNKQSSKIASRIGKIRSWRPPKSFLPVEGSFSLSKLRRRKGTNGSKSTAVSKSQSTPATAPEEALDIEKNVDKEAPVGKKVMSNGQQKPWSNILHSITGLKSEMGDNQGQTKDRVPNPTDATKDRVPNPTDAIKDREPAPEGSRRFSQNSAGSEVIW